MPDVFISYKREDRAQATEIAKILSRSGYTIWFDQQIQPGEEWDVAIERALAASKVAVVCWSALAVNSGPVKAEADDGRRRGILVPVLLSDCDIPLIFRQIQAADLRLCSADPTSPEFKKVIERVAQLLQQEPKAIHEDDQRWHQSTSLALTLEQGFSGGRAVFSLPAICTACNGLKQVLVGKRDQLGLSNDDCPVCKGTGTTATGELWATLELPPGAQDGDRHKVQLLDTLNNRVAGLADCVVKLRSHPDFQLDGPTLHTRMAVRHSDFQTGGSESVRHLDGQTINVQFPARSKPGDVIKIEGAGYRDITGNRGHLLVELFGVRDD